MKFAGIIEPGTDSGVVTRAEYVQGGYIVVQTMAERDSIPMSVRRIGSPVYVAGKINATFRWDGTTWKQETSGGGIEKIPVAAEGVLGGVMPGQFIKVDEEGRISVLTVDFAEEDNKCPINSGGVFDIVGKIDTILDRIADVKK